MPADLKAGAAPQFTVVIPVHNKAAHVREAGMSALGQTKPPYEVIIIDDASTDASMAEVQGIDSGKLRVLTRSKPGPGGYAARNVGIHAATTEWIAFLDADDTWDSRFLEDIGAAIADAPSSVGCAFTGYVNRGDGPDRRDIFSNRLGDGGTTVLDFEGFLETWIADRQCPIWTSASAFRKDVLIEAGLFPECRCKRGGDKDLWLRAVEIAPAIACGSVRAFYRLDATNQVTKKTSTNSRHCLCESLEIRIERSNKRRQTLLRRLFNLEVFLYAKKVALKEPLAKETYRGFFAAASPVLYAQLKVLELISFTRKAKA